MLSRDKIPNRWKDLKTSRSWWSLYRGGRIEVNGIIHKVDVLLVKEGLEEYVKSRIKKEGWKTERLT